MMSLTMKRFSTRRRWPAGLICLSLFLTTANLYAQAAKKSKLEIPKVETLNLPAGGGLTLNCFYFPGGFIQKSDTEVVTKPGKEVVPVILLHGFEGRAADYSGLAFTLQRLGHAVFVPDLRGHGASNKVKRPDGSFQEIQPDKLRPVDFAAMLQDVELVKRVIYDKNNAGQMNVEMLCLVGADLGAIVAANWAALDWSRRDLPAFRQGKSVKALVLLSPVGSVKGYSAAAAWRHPLFQSTLVSIMLVAGKRDSKSYSDAKQLYNRLEKAHRQAEDNPSKQSLFLIEPDTELSGTKLVDPRAGLPVTQQIGQFVALRLANRQSDLPWSERKNPLDQ